MKWTLAVMTIVFSLTASAETLRLPQGKGKCPSLSLEGEKQWSFKSTRAQGDRWDLRDSEKKIARFDFKLSNTDQKQLSEVEQKVLQLGGFKVEKLTVTTSFPNPGQRATEGLITSYTFLDGKLKGLVVMTEEYDADSNLDKKLEKALATIKIP